MARNKTRRANKIQEKKIIKIFAVLMVLTLFGFVYVMFQNRIVHLSNDVKELEVVMSELEERKKGLALMVEQRKSPQALKNKVAYFNLEMVSITQLDVVEVSPSSEYYRNRMKQKSEMYAGGYRR